ncbi:MAG: metallophosphoesterase family protein [Planctomycetota bacterium]
MKILHTADVHLQQTGDERWNALRTVVELARAEDVDALVAAGDLFDADADARSLRGELRALLGGNDFPVLLLPGNHDRESYRAGLSYGPNTHVLGSEPFLVEGAAFAGLPYEDVGPEEVLARLRRAADALSGAEHSVLAYHGELLDAVPAGPAHAEFGDEGEGRYMPVKLSYFEDLPIDYVLAGHFHAGFDRWDLPGGGHFCYAGSPISITRRETGRRCVDLFQTGQAPAARELDTPHYRDLALTLDPFQPEDPVELVERALEELPASARPLLRVGGYVDAAELGTTERELVEAVTRLGQRCADCVVDFRDVSSLLQRDLFKQFERAVRREVEEAEEREKVVNLALRAMMEAL